MPALPENPQGREVFLLTSYCPCKVPGASHLCIWGQLQKSDLKVVTFHLNVTPSLAAVTPLLSPASRTRGFGARALECRHDVTAAPSGKGAVLPATKMAAAASAKGRDGKGRGVA